MKHIDAFEHGKQLNIEDLIPSQYDASHNTLMTSTKIQDNISKDVVTAIGTEEIQGVKEPNFVIDFTALGSVEKVQVDALRCLVNCKEGNADCMVYLLNKGVLQELGRGNSEFLNRMIIKIVRNVFGSCRVLRNLTKNAHAHEMLEDITTMRLTI